MLPAIDAGNGRFKIAVPDSTGNPKLLMTLSGQPFFTSVAYFEKGGSIIIGSEAENAALANPQRAVFDWKREMGTDKILYTDDDGKTYIPPDILAIFLGECKNIIESKTGHVANDVVILIPANYNDKQKQQTIDAAGRVGINVELLAHEPTCAALGNDIHKKRNCRALVFDPGAGTFDVSIVQSAGNMFEVIATGGEPQLGSRDFNRRATDKVLDEFEAKFNYRPTPDEHPVFCQNLAQQVEQLKISLSAQKQFHLVVTCRGDLLKMTITREQFESWIKDLVEQTIQRTEVTVKEAKLEWFDIDEIYAVGGGSMTPLVIQMLEQASSKKVSQRCEAHSAAALGGVIAGRLEYQRKGKAYNIGDVTLPPPDFYMREILSRSIGIVVLDQNDREICWEMLAKNTRIPSIQTRTFKMSDAHQTQVFIKVLDGEHGAEVDECVELGNFELTNLPPRPDLISRVEITFHLDANGMLIATARDIVSGKTAELKIAYKDKVEAA